MSAEWRTAAWAGATALGFSLLLTPLVRAIAVRYGWVGRPLEVRWGRRVTARLGGVAMFVSCVGAILYWVPLQPTIVTFLVSLSLVFVLGIVDDIYHLPPYTKLVVQLLIGCFAVASGLRIMLAHWTWLSIPLSVLWFVFVMNAFNLLDNMDGLAAGIGALAAGFCAFHAGRAQEWSAVLLSTILMGTCLGFLRLNFPPAKVYMGDSGSHLLGLGLGMLALVGSWRHPTQLLSVLVVPVLVLAVPIFDTCFVTIQRLAHRQHPFQGGRDHVSHRLAILGLSTRQVVTALYAVSGLLGLLSVLSSQMAWLPAVMTWLLAFAALLLFGAYLGKVNVYRVESPLESAAAKPATATTLVETMLLHKRRLIEILVDFCILSSTYVFAYLLRFEGVLTSDLQRLIMRSLPIILVIKLTCHSACGLYRGLWRYLGLSDLMTIFKAVACGSIVSMITLLYLWRFEGYSRAVLIIDWMLSFLGIAGARVVERLLDEWIASGKVRTVPVLIIGAGDTGERVLRYLRYEEKGERSVIGFLDDDIRKCGTRIHGVPVLGTRTMLAQLIDRHAVRAVLVAITDPPGGLLQEVQSVCEPRGVAWSTVSAGVITGAV